MAIILWVSGFQLSLYAQQAAKLSPKVMAAMNAPLAELKVKRQTNFITRRLLKAEPKAPRIIKI